MYAQRSFYSRPKNNISPATKKTLRRFFLVCPLFLCILVSACGGLGFNTTPQGMSTKLVQTHYGACNYLIFAPQNVPLFKVSTTTNSAMPAPKTQKLCLFLHGDTANVYWQTNILTQYNEGLHGFCQRLANAQGCPVIAIARPTFGLSVGGRQGNNICVASTSAWHFAATENAVQTLITQYAAPDAPIILAGYSTGARLAAQITSQNSRITQALLWEGVYNTAHDEHYKKGETNAFYAIQKNLSEQHFPQKCHVVLAHGTASRYPVAGTTELYTLLSSHHIPVQFEAFADNTHEDFFDAAVQKRFIKLLNP